MILVAFRHGLRVSELVDLRWDQIDFTHAVLHVRRAKKGTPATHPVVGDEMRALRKLQREQDPKSPFVFTSERGSPFTTAGFARMVERAGDGCRARLEGSPAHAAPRLWLCAGQQGPRYASVAGLPRPPQHPAHGAIHRVVAGQVQGLLEMTEFVWLVLTAVALQRGAGNSPAAFSRPEPGGDQPPSSSCRPRGGIAAPGASPRSTLAMKSSAAASSASCRERLDPAFDRLRHR